MRWVRPLPWAGDAQAFRLDDRLVVPAGAPDFLRIRSQLMSRYYMGTLRCHVTWIQLLKNEVSNMTEKSMTPSLSIPPHTLGVTQDTKKTNNTNPTIKIKVKCGNQL